MNGKSRNHDGQRRLKMMLTKHVGDKIFSVFSSDEKVLNHYKVFHCNRKTIHARFVIVKVLIILDRSNYSFTYSINQLGI